MSYYNVSRSIEEGKKFLNYFKSPFPFIRSWARKKCLGGHNFVLTGRGKEAWQGHYLCTNYGLEEDRPNMSFTD